jgi:hypothetical protein
MTSRALFERICDRCGKTECSPLEPSGWVKILLPDSLPRVVSSLVDGKDLCPQCGAEFVEWMKAGGQQ